MSLHRVGLFVRVLVEAIAAARARRRVNRTCRRCGHARGRHLSDVTFFDELPCGDCDCENFLHQLTD